MNAIEGPLVPPAPKNTYSRANAASNDKLFSELLFSAKDITLSNMAPHPVDSTIKEKSELIIIDVVKNQYAERKELHEQKLMANYTLSYIDVNNSTDVTPIVGYDVSGAQHTLIKNKQNMVMPSTEISGVLKPHQKLLISPPVMLPTTSIDNEEITISAVTISMLHKQAESIEKSKIVIGRQYDNKSLLVRDHFSDPKTLAAVVTDILHRLKSTIHEVIINGKRG